MRTVSRQDEAASIPRRARRDSAARTGGHAARCMHACGQVEAAAERILQDDHIDCLCVFPVNILYFGENPDILQNAFCMMIISTACAFPHKHTLFL
jgi:hypothetical protein